MATRDSVRVEFESPNKEHTRLGRRSYNKQRKGRILSQRRAGAHDPRSGRRARRAGDAGILGRRPASTRQPPEGIPREPPLSLRGLCNTGSTALVDVVRHMGARLAAQRGGGGGGA